MLHPTPANAIYVEVILPLALPQVYTYFVPEEWAHQVQFGVRVEVQFGRNKIYSAVVVEVLKGTPRNTEKAKPILAILDDVPVITPIQYQLWQWLAAYYTCTLGEVMSAALPANLKLASETQVIVSPLYDPNIKGLSDKEFIVMEALNHNKSLTTDQLRDLLQQKTVYSILKSLLDKKLIYLKEDFQEKYKPKTIGCVRLNAPYDLEENLQEAFELVQRSEKQTNALMAYLQISRGQEHVRKKDLYKASEKVDSAVLNTLAKKGIFELYEREVSRLGNYEEEVVEKFPLSEQQERAIDGIEQAFEEKNVVLLHGVTGSGKTRVFIELIQKIIDRGEQVLYLLPEIALTTQIVQRLQRIFGDQ
ncbi:MAG: DEAD/DEAH box helicase family protein, partial [Bacteroidota bacterium]